MTIRGKSYRPLPWMAHSENFKDHEEKTMVDHRSPNQGNPNAPKIQTSPDESTVNVGESQQEALDLAGVITMGLRQVMYSRTNMQAVERDVSAWIMEQKDRSPEAKKKVMDQMTNAKLAFESLYNRVQMEY